MKSNSKFTALLLLVVAEVAAMSLWFVSSAVLPEMLKEAALSPFSQAALSSSVQAGFVVGALVSAVVAYISIDFFMRFVNRIGLLPFAVYRLVLAAIILYVLI